MLKISPHIRVFTLAFLAFVSLACGCGHKADLTLPPPAEDEGAKPSTK